MEGDLVVVVLMILSSVCIRRYFKVKIQDKKFANVSKVNNKCGKSCCLSL